LDFSIIKAFKSDRFPAAVTRIYVSAAGVWMSAIRYNQLLIPAACRTV